MQPEIVFVATYPPRECGIATFTQDLVKNLERKFSSFLQAKICALNNNSTNIYNYPEEVLFQLEDSNIQEYLDLAKKNALAMNHPYLARRLSISFLNNAGRLK